jgi:FtsH-binding integral membrane protein
MNPILNEAHLFLFAIILFVVILLMHLLGVRTGTYRRKKNPDAVAEGIGPLETALLGLLSLLLSFTFGISASRYDSRRSAIITEANDISTAVLNADLYPDSMRNVLRSDFKDYLDERIAYYQYADEDQAAASLKKAQDIHLTIWKTIAALAQDPSNLGRSYHMIPALHDMSAAATSRDALRKAKVPYPIIWLLIVLTLLGSFIIGYGKKQRKTDWIILFMYALMTVITLFTILDLDNARNGLIKTEGAHLKMDELKEMFKN